MIAGRADGTESHQPPIHPVVASFATQGPLTTRTASAKALAEARRSEVGPSYGRNNAALGQSDARTHPAHSGPRA
jgi:hypothetical protein